MGTRNRHLSRRTQLFLYTAIIVFIVGYILYKGIQSFRASYFISAPERINLVLYGPRTAFYSLGGDSGRNYVMYLPPDLKMTVPGGYGSYRLGSLGKLASLDSDYSLIQKTLSLATTGFVHGYFYEKTDEVYYGTEVSSERQRPSISQIITNETNIGVLDKLYLAMRLMRLSGDDFTLLSYNEEVDKLYNDIFFEAEAFERNIIGLLYQRRYRDEQQNVQLRYSTSYDTARELSALLEGNGIRVNDITRSEPSEEGCVLVYQQQSQTLQDLADFFGCETREGSTDIYDILFVLGTAEQTWQVK